MGAWGTQGGPVKLTSADHNGTWGPLLGPGTKMGPEDPNGPQQGLGITRGLRDHKGAWVPQCRPGTMHTVIGTTTEPGNSNSAGGP